MLDRAIFRQMIMRSTKKCRRNDIMATKSFTDTYKIKRSDVSQFRNIMSDTRKLKIRKVKGHQDIRDKEEFRKMFGFSK